MGSESMKNLIQNWRSSMSGDRNVLKEFQILKEGLFDLALPGEIAETINAMFIKTPEKGKTIIGNLFKLTRPEDKFGSDNRRKLRELAKTFEDLLLEAGHLYQVGRTDIFKIYAKEAAGRFIELTGADYIEPNAQSKISLAKAKKYALETLENGLGVGTKKYPVSEENIQEFELAFDGIIHDIAQWFSKTYELVARWLNAHVSNYKDLNTPDHAVGWNMPRALKKAEVWFKDFNEEQIIHKFDDGFYWYDLRTTDCDVEAARMGHCGGGEMDSTLLSLRKHEAEKKYPDSYITISYAAHSSTIYQIKGKENEAPDESLWDYIAWLIDWMEVREVQETGEEASDPRQFEEMNQYLSQKTSAEFSGGRWEALETELEELKESYNGRYAYSSIYYMMSDDHYEAPSYSYGGSLGIPIPIEDFKEGILKNAERALNSQFLANLVSEMAEWFAGISEEDSRFPVKTGGNIVFDFPLRAGDDGGIYGYGYSDDQFESFGDEVERLDDLAGDPDSDLVGRLRMHLAMAGAVNGGPFYDLVHNYESGEYNDSEFQIEYDESNQTGLPIQFEFKFPDDQFFDLEKLKGKVPDAFMNPDTALKILKNNEFGLSLRSALVEAAGLVIGEAMLPDINYYNAFQSQGGGKIIPHDFIIELGFSISVQDPDGVSETADAILKETWTSEEIEEIIAKTYIETTKRKDPIAESIFNHWRRMIR